MMIIIAAILIYVVLCNDAGVVAVPSPSSSPPCGVTRDSSSVGEEIDAKAACECRLCVYELERRAGRTGFVREWYRRRRVGAEPVLSVE